VLLKFLEVRDKLSVQVHPQDGQTDFIPAGESGKSEAWVVLEASPASRIYAGVKPGVNRADLQRALASWRVEDLLSSFTPKAGDAVFVRAGTVHSLSHLMVFEVQENSDVTFRLYDWNRVDPKTGKNRPLQVEQAVECIDFTQAAIGLAPSLMEQASPDLRERLICCEHFSVWRHKGQGQSPFTVGAVDLPRVLVCIGGEGGLESGGVKYPIVRGDVMLLPAEIGECSFQPRSAVSLLEVALPE
jgi:mannose-6-phosphate isomerase